MQLVELQAEEDQEEAEDAHAEDSNVPDESQHEDIRVAGPGFKLVQIGQIDHENESV